MFPGLPSASFFRPSAYKDWKFERHFYRQAFGASTVLHLAHGPCLDGATCDVLVRRAYGDGAVRTVFLEPHETAEALDLLTRVPSRARGLVISDLSLQRGQGEQIANALQVLADDGWRITWRDHHHKQWEGVDLAAIQSACALTLDTTGTESGASLVQKDILPRDTWAQELALVARDHDLWLRQDPRSIKLFRANVAMGMKRWVRYMVEKRVVLDATLETHAARDERSTQRLTKWGLKRSRTVNGKRALIGVAYGRVPTNETLHSLEEKGAHMSILLKPSGTFSLRSRKDVPVCHLVAQRFGGGGHPNASGGRLPLGAGSLVGLWMRRSRHAAMRTLVQAAVEEVDRHLATREP